jgi:glycosyltransferase involved in cell wall biosynthesis
LDEAFFTGRLPEIAVSLDKAMFGTPNPDVADVRKRWSIPEGLPVVGTVGRAKPRKGTMVFMEAAARVLERTDAFFVAAGFDSKRDDAAPYRNSVRNFIRSKNMGHRVKLLPPAMVTPAFYRALDIFVLPSTWEGCSRTLLEAMCCERAVAASRVGGNPEVLDGGRAGKLFPPGDADALAACLHDLLESPSERHALAARGRKRFEGCFTMEKHAAQMEEIFMTLAGQTSQRAGAP